MPWGEYVGYGASAAAAPDVACCVDGGDDRSGGVADAEPGLFQHTFRAQAPRNAERARQPAVSVLHIPVLPLPTHHNRRGVLGPGVQQAPLLNSTGIVNVPIMHA